MSRISAEVSFKIRYRHAVRMLIVNAKTTTDIDILHFDVFLIQFIEDIVNPIAQSGEVSHIKDLRPYMEMETNELDILHARCLCNSRFHISHGNAELIFGKSRGLFSRLYGLRHLD